MGRTGLVEEGMKKETDSRKVKEPRAVNPTLKKNKVRGQILILRLIVKL